MKISIILVNYKTPQLTINCLNSIYQYDSKDIEIIIVDNFSQDNTEQIVNEKFPSVKFIQMGYNAGFARANNAGIRLSESEVVLLLNTDTIILNDAINNCLNDFLKSDYIACGVQLLNEDGSPQISGNYAMKGGLNYLLPLPYYGVFLKSIADLFKIKKPNLPEAFGTIEVDWINGAFLMVKKSAIKNAGLLDEDFFLYAEEAEWCSRLKKQGKLCIYGYHKVLHLQGLSANEAFLSTGKGYFNLSDKKGLQIMLSNFVRIRKEFGVLWLIFIFVNYLIGIPVFITGLIIEKLFKGKKATYQFRHWIGYCKNIFKVLNLLPNIIGNKPYFYKSL